MILKEIIICPICQSSELLDDKETIFCKNPDCKNIFPKLNSKPILVDFNNSILEKELLLSLKGKSLIAREKNIIKSILKVIFIGDSPKTSKNLTLITKDLNKLSHPPKILIVGGGTIGAGLTAFGKEFKDNIVSFDIYDSENIHFIADAHNIPLKDDHFDFIIIQAVLEHVVDPQKVVSECHRVLNNNGTIYAETPFIQQIHEGAYDFTRFTDSGHRFLFKNFELIKSGVVAGLGTSLMWSIGYFFAGLFRSKFIGKIFRSLFFWLRFFDSIISEEYNLDGASCTFFYGKKSNKTLSDKNLINYYKGSF